MNKTKSTAASRALIPAHLQKKIEIIFSPPRAFTLDAYNPQLRLLGYTDLPLEKGPFDLVLIDGPASYEESGQRISFPNGDLFLLAPHITPGGIVAIDGRKEAVRLYQRFLAREFSLLADSPYYTILLKH